MARSVVVMAVLVALLSACESMPWQKSKPAAEMGPLDSKGGQAAEPVEVPESGLALSTEQRFKDIPLPVGLKEDLDRTFVYESAALQVGKLVYSSRASLYDLTQFFLKECPTAGWKLDKIVEAGGKTCVFTKPGKKLEVLVQTLGMAAGRRVTLTLIPDSGSGL